MIAVIIALGAVVISLLEEGANLVALAADCFYAASDLVLLGCETLLELHLVSFAVAETSRCVTVCFALFGLAAGARSHV
jgi:hypothetical protein